MYDGPYQKKYMALKNSETTSIENLYQLDDKRLITLNFDNILRVFDLDTGNIVYLIFQNFVLGLSSHQHCKSLFDDIPALLVGKT